MGISDVTETFRGLTRQRAAIDRVIWAAVADSCEGLPPLLRAVRRLMEVDESNGSPFRYLPMALCGALTGAAEAAIPVVALSRVWWTGAETLDDVADGEFDGAAAGMTAGQAMLAGTVCATLIPQVVVGRYAPAPRLERAWAAELLATSLDCASGQLDDLAQRDRGVSWSRAMRSYAGKSGAPYARDVVMTALLAGRDDAEIGAWRAFGRLLGVLRQLANDRWCAGPGQDAVDLTNGVRTLSFAYAVEAAGARARDTLLELHARAPGDSSARAELSDMLAAPAFTAGYHQRINVMHHQLSTLLDRLVVPSDYRDIVRWMIDVSATSAQSPVDTPARSGRGVS